MRVSEASRFNVAHRGPSQSFRTRGSTRSRASDHQSQAQRWRQQQQSFVKHHRRWRPLLSPCPKHNQSAAGSPGTVVIEAFVSFGAGGSAHHSPLSCVVTHSSVEVHETHFELLIGDVKGKVRDVIKRSSTVDLNRHDRQSASLTTRWRPAARSR